MKTRFTIFVMLLIMTLIAIEPIGDSTTLLGTTTDAYVIVEALITARVNEFNITITNTGSTAKSISYIFYGYIDVSDTTPITLGSGTLVNDGIAQCCYIGERYYKVISQVKSTVAGNASTYEYSRMIPR